MRRKRVLLILAALCATTFSILWLSTVLAAAELTLNLGLTLSEGASDTITNSLLLADDPEVTGETLTYTLVTTPTNGLLALDGTTLTPTGQFTQADIDSSLLVYTHNDSETDSDSFEFTVETITDTIPQTTFLITVTPVFDQNPIVLDQVFSVAENSDTDTDVGTIAASDEDLGDSLSFTIVDGNDGDPFSVNLNSGAITVDNPTPLDFETNPSLTFTVQVEDLGALTDTAVITVNLTDVNEPPTLNDDTFEIEENSPNNDVVGTITATDPDAGETFTYTILDSIPADAFAIGSSSGQITVSDEDELDFETTPTFTLTIEVADSGSLTDNAQIVINLLDVNDPPTLLPAGPFSVPENSPDGTEVGDPMVATDDDLGAGDTLTFTITDGDDEGAFDIGESSGQIVVADGSLLDYETQQSYDLTIQVEDSAGATDSELVTVNLTDVNEPPSISNNNATFTINENSADGIPVGTVLADDPEDDTLQYEIIGGNTNDAFHVNTSGQIIVNNQDELDFETTPSFTLTIAVDDGENDAVNATYFVNLNDLNETPTINEAIFDIDENSPNGTEVGIVLASDPDENSEEAEWGELTFTISMGDPNGAFAIANDGDNNGRITVANTAFLDFETTQTFVLDVVATDGGGLSNNASVTININNLFDESPTVNNKTCTVSQAAANGVVVCTVEADDPELPYGDILTFEIIGGDPTGVFNINSSSGQITVPDTSKLDATATPTYNLTVEVRDRGGKVDTAQITINVSPLPIIHIFLPTLFNDYPPVEPNNNCAQAYSLGSGITYQFTSDDQEDWYSITLTSQRSISIILSNFDSAEGQLIVYSGVCSSGQNLDLVQSNGSPSSTKIINLTLDPGKYYIRVYSDPFTNTDYNLRVNFN